MGFLPQYVVIFRSSLIAVAIRCWTKAQIVLHERIDIPQLTAIFQDIYSTLPVTVGLKPVFAAMVREIAIAIAICFRKRA